MTKIYLLLNTEEFVSIQGLARELFAPRFALLKLAIVNPADFESKVFEWVRLLRYINIHGAGRRLFASKLMAFIFTISTGSSAFYVRYHVWTLWTVQITIETAGRSVHKRHCVFHAGLTGSVERIYVLDIDLSSQLRVSSGWFDMCPCDRVLWLVVESNLFIFFGRAQLWSSFGTLRHGKLPHMKPPFS
jgi:hypothetical protein